MSDLVVTCEHGGFRVPRAYDALFVGNRRLLKTHRGYDAGALGLARYFSHRFAAPLVAATVTRLLIDLNRSESHREVWSEFTRRLGGRERDRILQTYYRPFRARVEKALRTAMAAHSRVVHLSIHSFTPVLRGCRRTTDIGLLYDPARDREAALCRAWRGHLQEQLPGWRIHMNRPYQGRADGLTTFLRRQFPPGRYLGLELELNQRHLLRSGGAPHALCETLAVGLESACR